MRWDAAARPRSWTWTSPTERDERDAHIRELYAMGWTKQMLAAHFDLSVPRIHQIVGKS